MSSNIRPETIAPLNPNADAYYRPDVVAGKYDASLFDPTGIHLLVNEVFYSIQGEGGNAGKAAVFIRTAKCNLACKFCDTEFEAFTKRPIESLVNQVRAIVPPLDTLTAGEVGSPSSETWVQRESNPWVILTGGEPGIQNCGPLVSTLQAAGFRVALETGGTVWASWMDKLDHICVSPKVLLNRVPDELRITATEFKWIVNAEFMKLYTKDPQSVYVPGAFNYLQPESLNPKWTLAASKLVMAHPYRYQLSLQTHKMAGNP